MTNCTICNEKIKGKAKKLADGNTICTDCCTYSLLIGRCEECEKDFHINNLQRTEDGIYCVGCIEKITKKDIKDGYEDLKTWAEWLECCEEDETPEEATQECWLKWHEDIWEDKSERDPRKQALRKILADEMKKAA